MTSARTGRLKKRFKDTLKASCVDHTPMGSLVPCSIISKGSLPSEGKQKENASSASPGLPVQRMGLYTCAAMWRDSACQGWTPQPSPGHTVNTASSLLRKGFHGLNSNPIDEQQQRQVAVVFEISICEEQIDYRRFYFCH